MTRGLQQDNRRSGPERMAGGSGQLAQRSRAGAVRPNSPGSPAFYLHMQRMQGNRATGAYMRSSGLVQRDPDEDEATKEKLEMAGEVTDAISTGFGTPSDDLSDAAYDGDTVKDAGMAKTAGGTGSVAGVADSAGGIIQIISSIRDGMAIVKNDQQKSTANRVWNMSEKIATGADGAGKLVNGMTNVVDKSAKAHGHTDGVGASSVVSDYTGSVAEGLSAIKSAVSAVVNIYKMYEKYNEQGGLSKGDVAKGTLETLTNLLEAASSSLKVAKTVADIMETGAGNLTTVIPGVSIAVSGVKIAVKTVDVIKAGLNRTAMTRLKRDFKGKYESAGFIKAKRWFGGNAGVDMGKLRAHKAQLETRKAQGDLTVAAELEEITQYELAREMKSINKKRTTRGGLTIGIELVKIAGDIATLTGVGAQVGTPLKLVATGVGVALPIARAAKQSGRDRAANPDSWKLTKMVFNAEKSTAKKEERRSKDADLLIDMFVQLPAYDANDDGIVKQYNNLYSFVRATGVNLFTLEKYKSEPDKMKEKLVEAMAER